MKEQLNKYMKDNNLTKMQLAKQIGVSIHSIHNWRKGSIPQGKNAKRLKKLGIMLPTREERHKTAVADAQEKQDKKNMVKRPYRRHVIVPDILHSQICAMLDGYVKHLGEERTWAEFQEIRDTFVRDAYYLCKQGE